MKLSLNELHIKCRNAFRGLGFPPGADEDAAFIIGWLEIHRFEGLKHFSCICACSKKYAFPESIEIDNKLTINCSQCCGIAVIPGVFDFIRSAESNSEVDEVIINHCSKAIFLLPLILKYKDSQFSWRVTGSDSNDTTQIDIDTKSKQVFVNHTNESSSRTVSQIKLQRIDATAFDRLSKGEHWSFETLYEQHKQAIENGIEVDETQWQVVLDTAKKYLVPATAESRAKGAGGGDSND